MLVDVAALVPGDEDEDPPQDARIKGRMISSPVLCVMRVLFQAKAQLVCMIFCGDLSRHVF